MNKKCSILLTLLQIICNANMVYAIRAPMSHSYFIMNFMFEFIRFAIIPILFIILMIWQKKKHTKIGIKRIIIDILIFLLIEYVSYVIFGWILSNIK